MKAYNAILHFSIFAFTFAFAWFVFVYYPTVVRDFKSGNIPQAHLIPTAVASNVTKFPIQLAGYYSIEHDFKSVNYYAFIGGSNMAEYVNNKIAAELSLKNALSEDSLCNINIIFSSGTGLSVPDQYRKVSGC